LRYKKGHNSSKNCRKIVIIELDLDIHKIHLHATTSFNLTFHSQVIIWKPNTRTDGRTKPISIVPFDEASGDKYLQ